MAYLNVKQECWERLQVTLVVTSLCEQRAPILWKGLPQGEAPGPQGVQEVWEALRLPHAHSNCKAPAVGLPSDQAAINNHPHMHNEPRECDCNLHYTWRQLYIGLMCFAESKLLLSAFTNDTIFSSKRKGHKRAAYMGIRWEPYLNLSVAAVKFHAAQGTHCCLLCLK